MSTAQRRCSVAVAFAATCGCLVGMAVMAVLTALFRISSPEPFASVEASTAMATPAEVEGSRPAVVPDLDAAIATLRGRHLDIPLSGIDARALRSSFDERRDGSRRHEAMDLLAPRNTPVTAVEDGTIARLFTSRAGGLTIYQFDPTATFAYYYAHLDGYVDGLAEGASLRRGQVIGYVGTTGNAPKNTPHLHFAIFVLTPDRRWWQGTPVDPFAVLK